MNRFRCYPVALLVVMVMVMACGQASAETFTSGDGRFHVSMPADPKVNRLTVQTAAGPMLTHSFTAETREGAFVVAYFDLPTGAPPADRINAVLDGSAGGMVSDTKGTVLHSDKLEVAGFPARDVLWSFRAGDSGAQGRARLILVGARVYQVLALGKEGFVTSKPVLDYLESFKFDRAPGVMPHAQPNSPSPSPTSPTPPAAAPAGAPASWHAFNTSNNDGGYTVQLPAKPERGQAPGILGIKNRTMFTCTAEGLTFTIMGQPVPAPALKSGSPAVLKASRDALVSAHSGKVATDKSIRVGDFPVREFRLTSGSLGPNVILARSVLAGRRLYTVFVTGPEAAVSGPSARKFLNSFTPKQ